MPGRRRRAAARCAAGRGCCWPGAPALERHQPVDRHVVQVADSPAGPSRWKNSRQPAAAAAWPRSGPSRRPRRPRAHLGRRRIDARARRCVARASRRAGCAGARRRARPAGVTSPPPSSRRSAGRQRQRRRPCRLSVARQAPRTRRRSSRPLPDVVRLGRIAASGRSTRWCRSGVRVPDEVPRRGHQRALLPALRGHLLEDRPASRCRRAGGAGEVGDQRTSDEARLGRARAPGSAASARCRRARPGARTRRGASPGTRTMNGTLVCAV